MCDSQKRFWRRLEVYTPHSRGGSQGELPECKLVFGAICGDRKGYDDSLFCNYMQATKSDLITIIATPGIGQFNVRLLMVGHGLWEMTKIRIMIVYDTRASDHPSRCGPPATFRMFSPAGPGTLLRTYCPSRSSRKRLTPFESCETVLGQQRASEASTSNTRLILSISSVSPSSHPSTLFTMASLISRLAVFTIPLAVMSSLGIRTMSSDNRANAHAATSQLCCTPWQLCSQSPMKSLC